MTTDAAGRTRQVDHSVGIVVALALAGSLWAVVGHDAERAAEQRLAERAADVAVGERPRAQGVATSSRAEGRRAPPVEGMVQAPSPARRVVVVRRSRAS
jgi:CTP:molybdopterin cytidylyltransferase MocA